MIGHDDTTRREHHRGIIEGWLVEQYPGAYIEHRETDEGGVKFKIATDDPPKVRRLRVRRAVLEDRREDHEFIDALRDGHARKMLDEADKYDIVVLGKGEGNVLSVWK